MTAIEEMAGMDVLCSDKTGTLTLNRLTVDRNLIEVQELKKVPSFITVLGCYKKINWKKKKKVWCCCFLTNLTWPRGGILYVVNVFGKACRHVASFFFHN